MKNWCIQILGVRGRLFYSLTIFIIMLNVVILWLFFHNATLRKEVGASPVVRSSGRLQNNVANGDAAPEFQARDLAGKSLDTKDLKGKVILMLFFDPSGKRFSSHIQAVWYANVLLHKYNQHLAVIGISSGTLEQTQTLRQKLGVSISIIPNQGKEIHDLYGVPSYSRGFGSTILIDRNGIVRYSSTYPTDTDFTRQLVEVQVLGSANTLLYSNLQEFFRKGRQLETINLFDAEKNFLLSDLYGQRLYIAFFGTLCSPCVDTRLTYQLNKAAEMGAKVIGITGTSETLERISQFRKMEGLKFPIFQTSDPIIMELNYISRNEILTYPFFIATDQSGVVVLNQVGDLKQGNSLSDILSFIQRNTEEEDKL